MGQPSYNFHLLVSFNPKILHSFQPTVTARRNERHLVPSEELSFVFRSVIIKGLPLTAAQVAISFLFYFRVHRVSTSSSNVKRFRAEVA